MLGLYNYQRKSVVQLLSGKRVIYATMGSGKTAITLKWAEQEMIRTHKNKLLVITTASKAKTNDWQDEAKLFTTMKPKVFDVVSWHMAKKWASNKTYDEMSEYVVIFDELQRAKQGVSSLMGKSFLLITAHTDTWVGATGTPGDRWIDFYPYFTATGKVRNKTAFQREFCIMQHYPYPMVLGYKNEPTLQEWWADISYTPDTSEVVAELPPETHKVMAFPAPKGYKKVLKTRVATDGTLLDSNMALLHELRQMCATPDKLSALSDLLDSLSSLSPLVVFYNYTCEREQILGLAEKLGRKVWRIDGEKHEIPTADTIGKDDIVLCHYLSGSEALNLQFCNYWLSYSYNYSYSTSIQARGRIKRIGQTKPMFFFYFETEKTIEQEVKRALQRKQDFSEENWSPKGGD